MQRAAERDVIVPGGAGDELGVGVLRIVAVHQQAAGEAVIGLGDLIHEEHLRPGIEVEVVLVVLALKVLERIPRLGEIRLDILGCQVFGPDVLDGHEVIVAVVI